MFVIGFSDKAKKIAKNVDGFSTALCPINVEYGGVDISLGGKPDIVGVAGTKCSGVFCLPMLLSKEGEHCL